MYFYVILAAVIRATSAGSGSTASDPTLYCIVGGGPAGLQLARHFEDASRDYLLFERAPNVAAFYRKYPIHRKLISINKRFTGFDDLEFNLRHDWNSLLNGSVTDPFASGPLPFTKWSEDFFPSADVLVNYLDNYAQEMMDHIRLDTDVSLVSRATVRRVDDVTEPGDETSGFRLELRRGRPDARNHYCQIVVLAVGLHVPRKLKMMGWEHAENYQDISPHGRDFTNQRVAIIGNGNTAHEISQELHGHTAHNHLFSRRPTKFSFYTHYVGDVRAVNLGTVDTYQLKSLDAIIDLGDNFADVFAIVKCRKEGRRVIMGVGEQLCIRNRDKTLEDYLKAVGYLETNETVDDDFRTRATVDEQFWSITQGDNSAFRMPYDRVIAAVGWIFNSSIFAEDAMPAMSPLSRDRFPAQRCNFESVNVPNLYFAGVLSHARDYRRSAGGFIHGWRYLIRALFKTLERDFHTPRTTFVPSVMIPPDAAPVSIGNESDEEEGAVSSPAPLPTLDTVSHWPGAETIPVTADAIFTALQKRVSQASGLYQMFGELVDVVLIDVVRGEAKYLVEVPRCMCAAPNSPQQHANWGNNTFAVNLSGAPWDPNSEAFKEALEEAKAAVNESALVDNVTSGEKEAISRVEVGANGERTSPDERIAALLAQVSELEREVAGLRSEDGLAGHLAEEARKIREDEDDADTGPLNYADAAEHGYARFVDSKSPEPLLGEWHDDDFRDCAMCDDRFDKLILSFKYRHDFHGPGTIGAGRVGSQSHHTAEQSTFLHPVIEFIPKARGGWAFEDDAPPSSIHLVEDVQALWDTEMEHLDPLRSWLSHLVLNLTIADVLSDAAFLEENDLNDALQRGMEPIPSGRVERLTRMVELAGDTEKIIRLKTSLRPGMLVKLTRAYSAIPPGSIGTFIAAEPAFPPAIVRFESVGGWAIPVHWEHIEILPGERERASDLEQISLEWEERMKRTLSAGRELEVVLNASYLHYPAIWKATEKERAEKQTKALSNGGSRGATLTTNLVGSKYVKFVTGEIGTVVGYNSIDGDIGVGGEPLEFPQLSSGARVLIPGIDDANNASSSNSSNPRGSDVVLNVAWHELIEMSKTVLHG